MMILHPNPEKNFNFFYRTRKVSTVISKKKIFWKREGGLGNYDPALLTQKKETQNKPQYLKSLICKGFADSIFNTAIRINLFLIVYIFNESIFCEGRKGGLIPKKIIYPTGDSRQYKTCSERLF